MSRIISIGTALPEHRTDQHAILEFMQAAYGDATASRKLSMLFNHSGISARYSVLPDFDKSRNQHVFFNGVPSTASVLNRLDEFKKDVIPLSLKAVQDAFRNVKHKLEIKDISHVITVSCTGIYAPGMDAELITELGLPEDTYHTAVNFMGCNAAFHALRIADMILRTEKNAQVLIVCTELCTLHFQPKNDHDNLLSNTIFGDGSAAVILSSDDFADTNGMKGFSIEGFYGILLDKGKDLMGWNITPQNFEMILNASIPEFIGNELGMIIHKAGKKLNIGSGDIKNWAIHPGGKKILDTIQQQLQLSDKEMSYSFKVLEDFGNMSSPTILFVLKELMEEQNKQGETIFSIGFGPGLSIETALLRYA
jgi:predicted naringenin-chalcone synthase